MGGTLADNMPWSARETMALSGLMALALLVRFPHLLTPYVINPDAIHYVESARALSQGRWIEAFGISHASIFPVLIAAAEPVVGDWVGAARLISICFGLLTVVPIYLIARELLPGLWALLPPLFYDLCPALTHYSLDVIREPMAWFFFSAAVWILLRAQRLQKSSWFFLCAIFVLAATAVRLDGLVILGISMAWILLTGLRLKAFGRAIMWSAALLAPTMLVTCAALALYGGTINKRDLFEWRTYQRQIQRAIGGSDQAQEIRIKTILDGIPQARLRNFFSSAWENRRGLAAWDLLRHWASAANPLLLILTLLGLVGWRTWRSDEAWWFIALLVLVWLCVGYVRLSGAFAISKRHLGPLVISGYFFAALGFMAFVRAMRAYLLLRYQGGAIIIALTSVALATLPWTLHPQRVEKLPRRLAGEWIREQGLSHPVVATEHQILAFYAGGKWLPLKEIGNGKDRPDFLALEQGRQPQEEVLGLLEKAGWEAVMVHEIKGSGRDLLVYRILPGAGSMEREREGSGSGAPAKMTQD